MKTFRAVLKVDIKLRGHMLGKGSKQPGGVKNSCIQFLGSSIVVDTG